MKRRTQSIVSAIAALAALALSDGVAAQQTWNYGTTVGACDAPPPACSPMPGGTGPSAIATVYGYGTSGAAWVSGTLTNQGGSGLGYSAGETSPDHAFDSRAGSGSRGTATTEMLLIGFDSKVNLTNIALGWTHKDSDVSVLRWDGSASPITSLAAIGNGVNGLAGAGWALVSSRDADNAATTNCTIGTSACDLGSKSFAISTGTDYNAAASDNKVSSWWMISTYFGAATGWNGQRLDSGNDFFKILSFTGNVCQYSSTSSNGGACTKGSPGPTAVPEPTSLALVSLALAGVVGIRRRHNLSRC